MVLTGPVDRVILKTFRLANCAMTLGRCSLDRQSGFTLLELLVALVVLGLLVVGLTQGVRAGLTMWDAQSRRLSETAELDAGARVLRGLLSGFAAPLPGTLRRATTATIEASSDKLTFVSDLPTGLGTTRLANITIELVGDRLVLRWTPRVHEVTTEPAPEPIETELIRRVEHLDIAYLASPAPNQPAGWLAQVDASQFPQLIRVRLTFPKGDRRRWPDLIVATLGSR